VVTIPTSLVSGDDTAEGRVSGARRLLAELPAAGLENRQGIRGKRPEPL
jgi:hypothetical protein